MDDLCLVRCGLSRAENDSEKGIFELINALVSHSHVILLLKVNVALVLLLPWAAMID